MGKSCANFNFNPLSKETLHIRIFTNTEIPPGMHLLNAFLLQIFLTRWKLTKKRGKKELKGNIFFKTLIGTEFLSS